MKWVIVLSSNFILTDKPSVGMDPPFSSLSKESLASGSRGAPRPKKFCPDPLDEEIYNRGSHPTSMQSSLSFDPIAMDGMWPARLSLPPTPTAMPSAPIFQSSPSLKPSFEAKILAHYTYISSEVHAWVLYLECQRSSCSLYVTDPEQQDSLAHIEAMFSQFLSVLYEGANSKWLVNALVRLYISGSLLRTYSSFRRMI
jgi:hypothetical protein